MSTVRDPLAHLDSNPRPAMVNSGRERTIWKSRRFAITERFTACRTQALLSRIRAVTNDEEPVEIWVHTESG